MFIQSLPTAYQSAYCQSIQPTQEQRGDLLQIVEQNSSQTQEDQVSISAGGRLLSNLPPLFNDAIDADGVITLDEMRSFLQEKIAGFQEETRSRLTALGVDVTSTIDLTTDTEGNVIVANDHPDKDKIEAMFADNPELASDFRQLSAVNSLAQAGEAHSEFAADYEADPKAAVAKHWHLFDGMKDQYVLRLIEGSASFVKSA